MSRPEPVVECPHGEPRGWKRCALCRRERRVETERAKLRAALRDRFDVARARAGDVDEPDDGPALW